MQSLISIIVPIYKVEPYLDRCVDSIIKQTYTNLEIILVDDGSPDNCPAMCDAWAEADSRIRVIHKKNGGLSDARNAGLAIARGDFIAFIDSDDRVAPSFVETLYASICNTSADIAECAVTNVLEDGTVISVRSVEKAVVCQREMALRRLVLEDGIYPTVWDKLYRRSVIDGIWFEVGKQHEDEYWTYQVLDRAEKIAVIPEKLYDYLQRSTSIMGVGYALKRLDGLQARFLRMEYLQKYPSVAALVCQYFLFDCMWHYQCAERYLNGNEREQAVTAIRTMIQKTPPFPMAFDNLNILWLRIFRIAPGVTAKVRNFLKIGL